VYRRRGVRGNHDTGACIGFVDALPGGDRRLQSDSDGVARSIADAGPVSDADSGE
jgi:hypothetical protein